MLRLIWKDIRFGIRQVLFWPFYIIMMPFAYFSPQLGEALLDYMKKIIEENREMAQEWQRMAEKLDKR